MDQVEEVKSKVDLVELVASYVPLKKAGRNFSALCPFHSEKTPSFMISSERQVFKCFGCGEGGDAFTFLQKIEGWDFREALEELAKRVGVTLKSYVPTETSRTRERLIAINNLVNKFWVHLLNKHPIGEPARQYLEKRGIKKSALVKFGLGYAPSGWENTLNFLTKRGIVLSDLAQAGLIVARVGRDKSFYDRFRDRITFPLKDSRGTILGFSGRLIAESEGREAKYINLPQTPTFDKGAILFGIDLAREAIRKKNEAVLVEGEFDVISAHQAGISNVIASKGTALTDKQVALLSRICENVVLCFDTDLAGDAASRRGIGLLDISGVNVKVVRLFKYQDPDEFSQKDPVGFRQAIEKAINIYDYYIESATARFDPKTVDGKKKIGQEILPILAKISDDLVRAHYIEKLARLLDLEVRLVAEAVENKSDNITSTSKSTVENVILLEGYFLALLLARDEIVKDVFDELKTEDFENEKARKFWQWLRAIIRTSKTKNLAQLLKKLPKELDQFVDDLYLVNISPEFSEKERWAEEIVKTSGRVKKASLGRQLVVLSDKIKAAQGRKDAGETAALTRKFDAVAKHLGEIKYT